ncbi:MAG TPA: aspartate aminotransferase, partial [Lachnospiraceae bacterium]|nr:aspartate aminotransferase [Lachnospiraceae bacterium]
ALQGPQEDVELMRSEFERRRDYVLQRLRTIPGLSCPDIHGAFYVFFDMSAYVGSKWKDGVIENDVDFCSFLLEEAGVALMPGTPFYGANRVRISYATSMQNLRSALDIMEVSLKQLTRD